MITRPTPFLHQLRIIIGSLAAGLLLAGFLAGSSVQAAPGDLVTSVNLPVQGFGVSVGVDCEGNIYYT